MKKAGKWIWDNQHHILAVVWLFLLFPALTAWQNSILFVIIMSLYANFESSRAAGEAKQDREKIKLILEKVEALEKR
jgi:hypothetical protein